MADINEIINSYIYTLKMAKKSDKKEFYLYMKLTFIGLSIVGTIGFVIQFIGSIFRLQGS